MRKLPWYAFLYRLFGAQGTFWLWLIAPLAMWWTFEPAMIRLANRKPRPVAVKDAGEDTTARWVKLEGIQIDFDRRLLRMKESPTLPPAQILLDPSDPAGQWWASTRALVEPAEGTVSTCSAMGGLCGVLPSMARKHLVRRFARLEGDPGLYLPSPERSVILGDPAAPPLSGTPAPSGGNGLHNFSPKVEEHMELVRERVRLQASVTGVLDTTPPVLLRRLHGELALPASEHSLQVGRSPRELESIVFGVATIVLLFLGAGLYGARGSSEDDKSP